VKLVVGLGNPGPRYTRSRHNAGFQCVERIASAYGMSAGTVMFKAYVTRGHMNGERVVLARPLTFMNLSGLAVRPLVRWYHLPPADLLVVHDDLDLPLGKIRLREKGGAGGHKGMRSIIEALGSQQFARLRIGIGRPVRGEPQEYVLRDFTCAQAAVMEDTYQRAVAAVAFFVAEGISVAMNNANA